MKLNNSVKIAFVLLALSPFVSVAAQESISKNVPAAEEKNSSDFATLSRDAEAGNAKAQVELARAHFNGTDGLPVDYEKAVFWARKAAEQGDADGQNVLAICYDNGLGIPVDKQEAFRLLRLAAEQGLDRAQCNLALEYCQGDSVPVDEKEAEKWFLKAGEQGDASIQYCVGIFYDKYKEDSEKAEAWFRKVAEKESDPWSARAAYEIYKICRRRVLVSSPDASEEEKAKAAEQEAIADAWLQKAAKGGYADAQCSWGYCFLERDDPAGIAWVKKSAEQGDLHAQLILGHVYAGGICGVAQDAAEAVKWWTEAARQDSRDPGVICDISAAWHNLAASYMSGFGVPADEKKALAYLGCAYKRALGPNWELYEKQDRENRTGLRWYTFGASILRDGLRKADALWRKRGTEWLREHSEAGDPHAQRMLGLLLLKGSYKYLCLPTVPVNKAEGIAWLKKSATQGCPEGMYHLGLAYMHGDGVPQSEETAVAWWRKSAERGCFDAKIELKRYSKWKEEIALAKLIEAAKSGDAEAQCRLATCYFHGIGVPADAHEAYKLWLKAAEQGYAHAQYELGVCHRWGHGCRIDLKEAVAWYRKAAKQAHTSAMNNLGMMYAGGLGVEQDMKKAVSWWEKAAELGNADSQALLGKAYFLGNGVEQNFDEAAKWFTKGAEQGEPDSQFCLGYLYATGQGVKRDLAEAKKWIERAEKCVLKSAAHGDERAAEILRRIREMKNRFF